MKNNHFQLSVCETEKYHFCSQFARLKKESDIKCCQQCDGTSLAEIIIGKTVEKNNLAVSGKNLKLSVSLNQKLLLHDSILRNNTTYGKIVIPQDL